MNFKRFRNAIRGTRSTAGRIASGNAVPASFVMDEGATVFYAGDLTRGENCYLVEKILQLNTDPNPVIAFEGEIKPSVELFMKSMEGKAEFYYTGGIGSKGFGDFVYQYLYKKYGWFASKAGRYYDREYKRIFAPYNIKSIHFLNTEIFDRIEVIKRCRCETVGHEIPMNFYRKLIDVFYNHPRRKRDTFDGFDKTVQYEKDFGIDTWDRFYCSGIYARFSDLDIHVAEDNIIMSAKLDFGAEDEDAVLKEKILIGSTVHENVFEYKLKIDGNRVSAAFPVGDLTKWYNINLPCICVESCGHILNVPVLVSNDRATKVYEIGATGYAFEIRQDYRHLRFVIRETKVTDRASEKAKIRLAFVCSLISFWYRPIVLYEKYCRNYEESASVLFEKLIDEGYRNVKYILNADSIAAASINERYKKHIVDQFSFRHYFNLFSAKSIISSEALGHAMEKGTADSLFKTFVMDGSKNYVFLQHGVMYMVALSSEQRNFFRKGEGKGKQRVVVSSKLEAAHFLDNTNYEPADIYNCGLIKFDKSILNDNADRILVMLTWRPWEFVKGLADMNETAYYKMLRRIVKAVPDNLKNKLIVMPHPLVADQVKLKKDDEVWKYYVDGKKYDDLLKETKLLITDYSSISYDAFYRGSNVIFDWEEKEICMREYGENGHLMLTEELAFGDICYNSESMGGVIAAAYSRPQQQEHIENYSRIVEFHDGNNCGRFIEMAKSDGIL